MDMRTDLTAVPHAGLGFQCLRVHVRSPGSWGSSRGSEAACRDEGDGVKVEEAVEAGVGRLAVGDEVAKVLEGES